MSRFLFDTSRQRLVDLDEIVRKRRTARRVAAEGEIRYKEGEGPKGFSPAAPVDPFPSLDGPAWREAMLRRNGQKTAEPRVTMRVGESPEEGSDVPVDEQKLHAHAASEFPDDWKRREFIVARRDGYRCRRCERKLRKPDRSIHHIIPRDKGGGHHIDNLILLCRPCHDFVECHDPPLLSRAAIMGS